MDGATWGDANPMLLEVSGWDAAELTLHIPWEPLLWLLEILQDGCLGQA